MISCRRGLSLFVAFWMVWPVSAAWADVEGVIAKARRYVGSEEALTRLKSVHFLGTLSTDAQQRMTIEIIFQKPFRQRIVTTGSERMEITALDDYEGWQQIEDLKDKGRWRMKLLSKDQVKRLRANTWENLAFFHGIEKTGGRVEDHGEVVVDGRSAHKLSFVHATGSVFTRYFDVETGKMVLTETEQGGRIREEGEILSGGIRFPRRILTSMPMDGGRVRSVTIEFEKIVVDEAFADSVFSIPVMPSASAR